MYTTNEATPTTHYENNLVNNSLLSASGVSWSAIFAGATAAAALSLILLILGAGLGLSSVSPWAQEGVSAATFGVSTIAWITFMSLAASAIGGYIAGRLRTKWVGVHTDEVFFRDTAHGFLAWGVATLATAALLTSVIGAVVGGGIKAGASMVSGVASTASVAGAAAAGGMAGESGSEPNQSGAISYFVDSLFRRDASAPPVPATAATPAVTDPQTDPAQTDPSQMNSAIPQAPVTQSGTQSGTQARDTAATTGEVTRIFVNALWREEQLPADDVRYVGHLIAQQTDLSQAEAEQRVNDIYTRMKTQLAEIETAAKDAADEARATSAYASLWFFISLLAGAFIASVAATFGGRQRDL